MSVGPHSKAADRPKGVDTSQHGKLRAAVKCPHLSSENSATNSWIWNYNNQDMNNNNKSNNNCVVGVRDYVWA